VKELLRRKADVNGVTRDNKTPLYDAVDYDSKEIVSLLLGHGADMTIRSKGGRIALRLANEKHRTEIAELSRQHGATE
jgi:ankyrin repeat protein